MEKPAEKTAPDQAFIDRFRLQQGAVYFAQGFSMDEAMAEHNMALEKKVEELSARIEAGNIGSEEPLLEFRTLDQLVNFLHSLRHVRLQLRLHRRSAPPLLRVRGKIYDLLPHP
jgi:hypothetical protein